MRFLRRYDKGGKTKKRKEETVSVRKMSDREYTNNLGSEEQLLADALSNQGYDVSDLTSILGMTKIQPNRGEAMANRMKDLGYTAGEFIDMLGLMEGSSTEGKPQVRAYVDNNMVQLENLRSQDEGYERSVRGDKAGDEVYEEIAGRELKPSEERLLRKAMLDPALASYFMKLYGEESGDKAKVNVVKNVGRKSQNISAGTTDGGEASKGGGDKGLIPSLKKLCGEGTECRAIRKGNA